MNLRPTEKDRCSDCGEPIDPRNYDRERDGFICEPCANDRRAHSLPDYEQEQQS